jgi:hypothetical protein
MYESEDFELDSALFPVLEKITISEIIWFHPSYGNGKANPLTSLDRSIKALHIDKLVCHGGSVTFGKVREMSIDRVVIYGPSGSAPLVKGGILEQLNVRETIALRADRSESRGFSESVVILLDPKPAIARDGQSTKKVVKWPTVQPVTSPFRSRG